MQTAVSAFFHACQMQETDIDDEGPISYTFQQDVARGLRSFLVNMDPDDEQSDFFLDMFKDRTGPIVVDALRVEHLKEFLRGVTE